MEIRVGDPKRYRLPQIIIGSLLPGVYLFVDLAVIAGAIAIILISGGFLPVVLMVLLFLLVWLIASGVACIYFQPSLDSFYLRWLLRDMVRKHDGEVCHVWELFLEPRIHGGLRGLLDDCDDIGFLRLDEGSLRFDGDSLDISIPYSEIKDVTVRNRGARVMWVLGGKIMITVEDGGEERTFGFGERCAKTIPGSRRIAGDMFQAIKYRFGGAGSGEEPGGLASNDSPPPPERA